MWRLVCPRAELMALIKLLLIVIEGSYGAFTARVYTDSLVVYRGFHKGDYARHTPNGELWDEIFKAVQTLAEEGGHIQ